MGKSTIPIGIFNSKLLVYQRVYDFAIVWGPMSQETDLHSVHPWPPPAGAVGVPPSGLWWCGWYQRILDFGRKAELQVEIQTFQENLMNFVKLHEPHLQHFMIFHEHHRIIEQYHRIPSEYHLNVSKGADHAMKVGPWRVFQCQAAFKTPQQHLVRRPVCCRHSPHFDVDLHLFLFEDLSLNTS